MARTIRIAKYVEVPGPGGLLRPPLRRFPAKPPMPFFLKLRAESRPKFAPRRLTISIAAPGNPDARPEPVKITHT